MRRAVFAASQLPGGVRLGLEAALATGLATARVPGWVATQAPAVSLPPLLPPSTLHRQPLAGLGSKAAPPCIPGLSPHSPPLNTSPMQGRPCLASFVCQHPPPPLPTPSSQGREFVRFGHTLCSAPAPRTQLHPVSGHQAASRTAPAAHWVRCVHGQSSSTWYERYEELAHFVQQHRRMPRMNTKMTTTLPLQEGERVLGYWVRAQRRRWEGRKGHAPLSAAQISALEGLPGWRWAIIPAWEQTVQELQEFVEQHGRLPRRREWRYDVQRLRERRLLQWCGDQRKIYKGQRKGRQLTPQQVAALEAVPGWWWEQFKIRHRATWEERYGLLLQFVQERGRLPRRRGNSTPSSESDKAEDSLSIWCLGQRVALRGRSGGKQLTPQQVAALEAVPGWRWPKFQKKPWEERYSQVVRFVQQHARLPRQLHQCATVEEEAEACLGSWCAHQRQVFHGCLAGAQLAPQRVAALEAVPGWRWEYMTPWEERYRQVVQYVEEHGRLPGAIKHAKRDTPEAWEKGLGLWCIMQRRKYKRGNPQLTPQQVAALEAVPGWWWEKVKKTPWEERYSQVVRFVQQHGRLPRRIFKRAAPDGAVVETQLGSWCDMQKYLVKMNSHRLTPQQVSALEALPGWWVRRDWSAVWEQRCRQVVEFVEEHGRLPRVRSNPTSPGAVLERQLGLWCQTQRQAYRGGPGHERMSQQRVSALEAVPGWYWGTPGHTQP